MAGRLRTFSQLPSQRTRHGIEVVKKIRAHSGNEKIRKKKENLFQRLSSLSQRLFYIAFNAHYTFLFETKFYTKMPMIFS